MRIYVESDGEYCNRVLMTGWPLANGKNTLQIIWLSVTNTWNDSKNHNWPCVCVTCLWLRYHANLNWLVFQRPWIASGCATFYCVRTTKKYHKCIRLYVFNIQIEHCEQSQSEHNYDYSTYGKIPSRKKTHSISQFIFCSTKCLCLFFCSVFFRLLNVNCEYEFDVFRLYSHNHLRFRWIADISFQAKRA